MFRRVVKFGGSTLSASDHAGLLSKWLGAQQPAQSIVVVGGGDEIRRIARRQQEEHFSDDEAHWECIDVMRDNTRRLHRKLPQWLSLATIAELPPPDGQGQTYLLDPRSFMEDDAKQRSPLPESWDVSSDSIAARVAERFNADELVLLKSTLPRDVRRLGKYVDLFFATAAKRLKSVRFVNLRDEAFAEVRWR